MAEEKPTKETILEAFAGLSPEERQEIAAEIVRLLLLEGEWGWLAQSAAPAGCCPPGACGPAGQWGPAAWARPARR